MKLMGIPMPIVDLTTLSGVTTVVAGGAAVLPSLSASNNPSSGFSSVRTSAGQTSLGAGDSNTKVFNKANLESAFTGYSIDDGEIILDDAAGENDEYIVIPSS